MASLIDQWRNDTSFEESLVRQIEEQAAERERQMQAARRLSRSRRDAMQREADRLRDWAFQQHIILIYDPTCGTAPEAYDRGEAILQALDRYGKGDRTEATLWVLRPVMAGYNHLFRAKVAPEPGEWQVHPRPEAVAWAIATGERAY